MKRFRKLSDKVESFTVSTNASFHLITFFFNENMFLFYEPDISISCG